MALQKIDGSSQGRYNNTKKGVIAGGITGGAINALLYAGTSAAYLPFKNATLSQTKNYLKTFQDIWIRCGMDMSKTTVSKVIKYTKRGLKSFRTISFMVLSGAVIGAGIGLVSDVIKNHKKDNPNK